MKIKLTQLEHTFYRRNILVIGGQVNPDKKRNVKKEELNVTKKELNVKLEEELVQTQQTHQNDTFKNLIYDFSTIF